PKPVGSPSLSDFPHCDEEVRQIADRVWGDCDGLTVTEHAFGSGKVYWGGAPDPPAPDFESSGGDFRFIHRRDGESEIYFVSNQSARSQQVDCTFRVNGKIPELWRPDTGRIEQAAAYTMKDGRTTVPRR